MSTTVDPPATATTLRLPKHAKPSRTLGTDPLRKNLARAYIAQPNGHRELIATNSYVLARTPVDEDVPLGALSPEALRRIEKGERHTITEDGAVRFVDKDDTPIEYRQPEQTEMPFKEPPAFDPTDCSVLSIGLNPDLLRRLAEALGATQGVRIEIAVRDDGTQAPRGMRVTPLGGVRTGPTPEGLLMPIRLNV